MADGRSLLILDELQSVDSPEALRQAAEVLDEQCEELRARAREIGTEAASLRRRAIEVEREPPPHALDFLNGHRSTAEKILAVLRHTETPQKMSVIVTILGESEARTRATLAKLIEGELVVREGLKRGTTYRVPREGETVEAPALTSQRYEGAVRDAARRLGVFTFAEIADEVPVSHATLRRWLAAWVEQGALDVERVGKAYLYGVNKPSGSSPTHAPRWDPKPWELPEGGERARSHGKQRRKANAGRREVRDLLAACEAQGATVREAKHGYVVSLGDGRTSVPKTASDWRSLSNVRADLRKMGVSV